MIRALPLAMLVWLALSLPLAAAPARGSGAGFSVRAVLGAEAARAATREQLDLLVEAARLGSPAVQRIAVRALGRLERPSLVPALVPLLSVSAAAVRAEAANALAQAAGKDAEAGRTASAALFARLDLEADADARAAICEALGRLPIDRAGDAEERERALVAEAGRADLKKGVEVGPASPLLGVRIAWGKLHATSTPAAVGALRGLEALLRQRGNAFSPSASTLGQLRRLATTAVTPARRLAMLALNVAAAAGAAAADAPTIGRALGDEDAEVRRLAAAAPGATLEQVTRALGDRSAPVRYEALRAYGRRFQAGFGCVPVVASARDASPHVVLLALDLLGNACREGERAEETLLDAVGALPAGARTGGTTTGRAASSWHRPAHAIVSLAKVSPKAAGGRLPAFVSAEPWQVRMYAARAATELRDATALARLAEDVDVNVREAAITGLAKTQGHAADRAYLRAVQADDGQLAMAAARALDGTPASDAAVDALVAALQRWTSTGSDTSRDPRLAILERLEQLGSAAKAQALVPLLRDFDPRVAEEAARVLRAWTGEAHTPAPAVRLPSPVPSEDELARLARSIVRVSMRDGGHFDVRLLTDVAPLSCATFARLVAAGYYDGLTFHRVVANFLIQGGSPGANEYAGYPRFMLDEVGRRMQARGTLGTSSRGRDTGDAQVYINLVDSPRLDHAYTIFGEVVAGMETVDAILEGATIARAELRRK